ncbi:hypothetical protein BDM02DRAFT_1390877 [Thelephora ganbajun]|uniref:Uncharacterized protein n=1 Tax=Thelephora ganbajun TaxID=370292 RepID=A0ACB6ZMB6_THEGA|nr:hypothetical protein BDM02DRAFT_1390877 [Thelephora ganbajun]
MGELPQETICAIASCLDKHDLRNFSLISRAFVPESQRQLFRTVVLYHHRHFLRWCRIITPVHPTIPSYVRTFIVFFSIGFYNPPSVSEQDSHVAASEMFASFTKLGEIFLRNLTLRYPHQLSMVSNFSVSAPSLRSLRIEASQCSPGLMAKFIHLFPHLDDLHVEMVSITDDEPYDLPTTSLSLRGHGRFTLSDGYCSHIRFLPLCFKHLYLTFLLNPRGTLAERNPLILNEFLITCAPTLEYLTLCGESPPPSSYTRNSKTKISINLWPEMAIEVEMKVGQSVDLSPCKHLRTLRLELRELSERPPYLTQLLDSLKPTPHLEAITLVFYSSGRLLTESLRKYTDEWDPVDAQLCQLAELKEGGLRVSVGFNGFRTWQMVPLLGDFATFMAKFRCSPHSFTILCDSKVVTQEIELH